MRYNLTLVGFLIFATIGRADDAADQKDIRAVLDAQVIAWNKADLPGFMKGYWNSKELTFVSGKDMTRGWQETLDRYKRRYQAEGKEMGKLTFSEVEMKIVAPGVALVTGKWALELAKEKPSGRYTLLVKKTEDGWRIVHDHTST